MMVAILVGLPAPLLAIHLLWINLVTDGLPALCLASERIDPDVMRQGPRTQGDFLSDRGFRNSLLLTGALTAGVSLAAFLWGMQAGGLETARSFAFSALVFAELFRSLGGRSETRPIWSMNPLGNMKLLAVVAASMAFQVAAHSTDSLGGLLKTGPASAQEIVGIMAVSLLPLAVLETLKARRARGSALQGRNG
jgi:Ca2+-transporting ATPase